MIEVQKSNKQVSNYKAKIDILISKACFLEGYKCKFKFPQKC